jgi:Na+-transporting NADH:ubiquinone oxidoreductase subunit A
MKEIKLKGGLNVPLFGSVEKFIAEDLEPKFIGILSEDYFGLKPKILLSEGDQVKVGQPVIEDKTNLGSKVVSPISGVISSVNRGEKRTLISVEIENDKKNTLFELNITGDIGEDLNNAGLWDGFRERPFDRVPNINSKPNNVFVNCCRKDSLELSPNLIISNENKFFNLGLDMLEKLAEDNVFLCSNEEIETDSDNVEKFLISGKYPSGNSSAHINRISPIRKSKKTWTISWQDVIRIGKYISTKSYCFEKYVSVTGSACIEPKLFKTTSGASLAEITAGNASKESRLISGSALYGTSGDSYTSYLSRYTDQVTILSDERKANLFNWLKFGEKDHSATNVFFSSISKPEKFDFDTNVNGGYRAIVPIGVFDEVNVFDIDPTLFLKSLAIGDLVALRELGIFDLIPEDMSVFSYVCPSKYDYVALFKDCIEDIWKEENS